MNQYVKVIGVNVHRMRMERRLSLAHLASRSGIAKATLANLEKGRGNPTIETLWALAVGLGVAFGDLLEAPAVVPLRVVRAREGARVRARGGKRSPMDLRMLDRLERSAVTEMFEMHVPRDGHQQGQPHGAGIVEGIFLFGGRMLAGPSDQPTELRPGDFIRYLADRPHVYAALDGPCHGILVVAYPPVNGGQGYSLDRLEGAQVG
jgi:transcriptional regulator with XRE-family HTH domain